MEEITKTTIGDCGLDPTGRAAAEGDHTAEAYRDALWTYILGLVRAGVEELQNRPSAPETDGSQTYDYVQTSFRCTMTITQSEAIHYQPPEGPRAGHPIEIDEAERMMWTERVRGPKAGMASTRPRWSERMFGLARETRGEAANIACHTGV